jgi:hypothetical protein
MNYTLSTVADDEKLGTSALGLLSTWNRNEELCELDMSEFQDDCR